jgi:hypothetical protein
LAARAGYLKVVAVLLRHTCILRLFTRIGHGLQRPAKRVLEKYRGAARCAPIDDA